MILALALALTAVSALAQTPNPTPAYTTFCTDCSGTKRFGLFTPETSGGCQNYQANVYENWDDEGVTTPGEDKYEVAAQADIVRVNQFSDADFLYYQIVVRATNWNKVLIKGAHIELAFGDCSDPATRYHLLLVYDVDPTNAGSTWEATGNSKIKFYRDTDSDVGGPTNDGPVQPGTNTSDFGSCSGCDGYQSDVTVDLADAYARLDVSGGNATIEFAISRTDPNLLAVADPFTPCSSRALTSQTSTVAKDKYAINDLQSTSTLNSSSWTIDNCFTGCVDATAGPDQDICELGTTAPLGASGTGTWSIGGGGTGTFSSTTDPNATFTHTGGTGPITLNWTLTNSLCPEGTEAVVINIDEAVTADAGTDPADQCGLNQVAINATPPSVGTGVWSVQAGSPNTSTTQFGDVNDPTTTFTPTNFGTYTLVWTVTNGVCSDADTVEVTFSTAVTADAGPDPADQCGLGAASLNAVDPSPAGGVWSVQVGSPDTSAAQFGDVNDPTTTFTPTTVGTYTLVWTVTNGACSDTDTVEVSFSGDASADAGPDPADQCGLNQVAINAVTPSAGTGVWSVQAGSPNTSASQFGDPADPTTTFTPTAFGIYTLVWTVTNGACTVSDTVEVTFSEPVTADAGTDPADQCGLNQVAINAAVPGAGAGVWSVQAGSPDTNVSQFGDAADPTTTFTPLAFGTYTLVWTVTNGTCSDSDSTEVTFSEPVTADAGLDPIDQCGLNAVQINAQAPTVGTGVWSVDPGSPNTSVSQFEDPSDPTTTFTPLALGTYTLVWTVTNATCNDSDSVEVTFSATVTADAGPDPADACGLTAVATNATGTGTWSVEAGSPDTSTAQFGDVNDPTTTFTPTTLGTYILVWSVTNGTCSDEDTIEVTFTAPVTADAGPDPTDQCGLGSVPVNAVDPAPASGVWSVQAGSPNTSSAQFTDVNDPTTTFTPTAAGTYTLVWTVTSGACSDDDTVEVTFSGDATANAGLDPADQCGLNQVAINATDPAPGTGAWTVQAGSPDTNSSQFGDTVDPTTTFTPLAFGTYTLVWTVTNGVCVVSDTVEVTFSQAVTADAGLDPADQCGLTQVAINAATPAAGTGVWSVQVGSPTTSSTQFGDTADPTTTFTPQGHGTYTLVWTVTNGTCVSSDTVEVTFSQPVTANAGLDPADQCGLNGVGINAQTPSPGSGVWSVQAGSPNTNASQFTDVNDPTTTFTPLAAGTYTLVWTVTNGTCSSSDTIEVSFSATVTADAGLDPADQCGLAAASVNAVAPGVGTGAWSVQSGPNTSSSQFANTAAASTTFTPTAAGTYVLLWTVTNGLCSATDTVEVTFDGVVVANAGADPTDQCGLAAINLDAQTPGLGSGLWSVQSGPNTNSTQFASTTNPDTAFTPAAAGTYVLLWTVTNGLCSASDTVEVTFSATVTADAGPDPTDQCGLGGVAVTAVAPGTGTGAWSVQSGPNTSSTQFANTAAASTTFTPTAAGTYVLLWTVTNGTCSISDTAEVTFSETVTADAGPDPADQCGLGAAALTAVSPSVGTGVWSVQSGPNTSSTQFANSAAASTTFTPTAAGTYVLLWTVTNGQCNAADSVEVTFDSAAVANAGVDPADQCGLNAINLDAETPAAGTGVWSVQSGPNSSATQFANTSNPDTSFTPTAAGTYVLLWTVTNGTCSVSDTAEVTFSETVTADAGPDPADQCGLGAAGLTAVSPSVGTGVWSVQSGPNTSSTQFANSAAASTTFTPTAAGTYVLLWTVTNGQCNAADSVEVTFDSAAVANAGLDPADQCGLNAINLDAETPAAGSGVWSVQSGPDTSAAQFASLSNPDTSFTPTVAGTYVLLWTVTNGQCSVSDSVEVTFSATVTADAGPDPARQCGIGSVTLDANTPAAGAGVWSVLSGPDTSSTQFASTSNPDTSFTPTVAGTYVLQWSVTNGTCSASDTVTAIFDGSATASAGADASFCSLAPVTLGATAVSPPASGQWSIVSGGTGTFGDPSNPTTTFTPNADGTYALRWTVTNGTCTVSDDVVLTFGSVTASAGPDQDLASVETITLAGSVPSSGTGLWTIVSGGTGTFSNASSPTSTFTPSSAGTYVLRWTVTSGTCTASDTMTAIFAAEAEPAIPTASFWGLIALMLSLGIAAWWSLRSS